MSKDYMAKLEGMLEVHSEDHGIDWGIKADTAHECGWCVEVRVTDSPNADGPDESRVWMAAGGGDPQDCAQRLYPVVKQYLERKK